MSKKWLPADYQDEMIPDLRDSPDDWIAPGCAALAAADEECDPMPLTEGEVVKFDWCVSLGRNRITVTDSDTWTCDADIPSPPEGGDLCIRVIGDDRIVDSADDLARQVIIDGDGPGSYEISIYAWSWKSVPYEFRDGHFHPLATA